MGRGLALDLTFNTDFAESEADEQRVNLSRFSLFRPFFSRRVGLGPDGEPVPIEFGARLTGRTGPWSVGLPRGRGAIHLLRRRPLRFPRDRQMILKMTYLIAV